MGKLKAKNKCNTHILRAVPRSEWNPETLSTVVEMWRSAAFFVVVHQEKVHIERISVSRFRRPGEADGGGGVGAEVISWEELQDIKRQIGRGERFAVEVYPHDADVVNVANIRHLWVLPVPIQGVGWGSH